jgi:hypothetical protein
MLCASYASGDAWRAMLQQPLHFARLQDSVCEVHTQDPASMQHGMLLCRFICLQDPVPAGARGGGP